MGIRNYRAALRFHSFFAFLWMILGATTFGANRDEFSDLQRQYFSMLDLRAGADQLAALPNFSARLSAVADVTREQVSKEGYLSAEQKSAAGLILIYDALMTHKNTLAILDGALPLAKFVAVRRFAAVGSNDREELIARERYARTELDDAKSLRPDDRRIDSWKVSVNASLESLQTTGHVSDATLESLLDAIPARPTFNLWTALLVFRERDASTELFGRLISAAKDFVDSSSNPCTMRPQDCSR